jgi:hypothetical protein
MLQPRYRRRIPTTRTRRRPLNLFRRLRLTLLSHDPNRLDQTRSHEIRRLTSLAPLVLRVRRFRQIQRRQLIRILAYQNRPHPSRRTRLNVAHLIADHPALR